MADEKTYYAPGFEDADKFHILGDATAIYGLCGKQIDNSNDQLRDRRPSKNVCPACEKLEAKEEAKDE